ncbi:MAG: hypothetical protein QM767_12695 [Anaeromyxobacter sp.]
MPPSLGSALSLSLSALRGEAWLAAPGLLVAWLRRALRWPALAVAVALVMRAAVDGARAAPLDLLAPLEAAAAALTAPRFIGLVGGLWLAGLATAGALRVAWIAGALPVLGARMAGQPTGAAGFAGAMTGGFPRVLASALLAFVMELAGGGFALALLWGAARIIGEAAGGGGAPGLAAAVALALTLALAVPAALSTLADAAVSRAAVLGEWPAAALAAATRRFLLRPGTFLLGGLGFGAVALLLPALVESMGGLAGPGLPTAVALGPKLMLATAALVVGAAVELAWLGTVAALACGQDRG